MQTLSNLSVAWPSFRPRMRQEAKVERDAHDSGIVPAFEALFAGPISGASMNPARSLAPALVSGSLEHLWVYLTAPVIGSLLAVAACMCVHDKGCCGRAVPVPNRGETHERAEVQSVAGR